ncbi:Zinc finger protein 746 [Echinococcus granulosus]|uniref:Zinc finger protein n=1 Tax=Echinococcus granulosus TaxID=6210 RepID=U6J710_ECHGR|nr:Zinc finger protein 746 [Echinococcus granulosus]EUB61141.1 Zinc finger protein 746 [Echinococcus granulosus]CDS19856.1 zinc finger protein [Echinococcus granulosus]
MSQGLTEVLTNGFNLNDFPFGLLNAKPLKKSENSPVLSPETRHSAPSTPTPVSSTGYMQLPFVEKSIQPSVNGSTNNVKEKLLAALREIIPHKSSLNLRMLITYTVDNARSDVIVIDETLNRKDCESLAPTGNILDLSRKSEDSTKPFNKENNVGCMIKNSATPILGLVSNTATPFNIIQPTDTSPPVTMNPEAALLMLQTLLNNTSTNLSQFGSFNFSLPMNLTHVQQAEIKSQIFPSEIAPNITITNCENILSNLQFGPKLEASVPATNESGSRSSSPLSNHERSSPLGTFKPLPKSSAQSVSGTFSRRYMHPRRFICNQCRQQFSSLAELNRHTLELHNSFRCNFCKAKFTQRSNLQRHSLKHVGFKPFTCNICQKEYYRKDHLVRHIEVTHPNVDPRVNITTRLTSSECLDFLDNLHVYGNSEGSVEETSGSSQNETLAGSKFSPVRLEESSRLTDEGPSEGRIITLGAGEEGVPEVESPSKALIGKIEQSQPMET